MPRPIALSKSRYTAGLQCHKLLWWRVHEPDAPELTPDEALQATFDQGTRVGEIARTWLGEGRLITGEYWDKTGKVARTREALAAGATRIFEASFEHEGVFVAVDALEKSDGGYSLTEVKSTTKLKPEHLPDIAVQRWVVEGAGLPVVRAELCHLSRECHYPDLSNLFEREEVTEQVAGTEAAIEKEVAAQFSMLSGPLPVVEIGEHCKKPYECPFISRCWADVPPHSLDSLMNLHSSKRARLEAMGVETIPQIPADFKLTDRQERQRRAVVTGEPQLDLPGLRTELLPYDVPRIAFLDFETVGEAIPCWDGLAPFDQMPAQFSCHLLEAGGKVTHFEWIAGSQEDPRPALAAEVLRACGGADLVVAFNAHFERRCLELLAAGAPSHAEAIAAILGRLHDLKDAVEVGIYHPEFGGSYSLKPVIAALLPDLAYDDLDVAEGATASVRLRRLMFEPGTFTDAERAATRQQLLTYCGHDTLVMVKLLEKLRELAAPG